MDEGDLYDIVMVNTGEDIHFNQGFISQLPAKNVLFTDNFCQEGLV